MKKPKNLNKKLVKNPTNPTSALRQNVDTLMDIFGYTLSETSEKADISLERFKSFFYGKSEEVRLSTAIKLAKLFGISVDELVGSDTLNDDILECIKIYRQLPESMKELALWHMKDLEKTSNKYLQEKVIKVMVPVCSETGNLKSSNDYEEYVIKDLDNEWAHKVYIGIKIPCNHFLPHYTRNTILLIANDRNAFRSENTVLSVGGNIAITKRVVEKDSIKHYSIRDGAFRYEESERVHLLGYVAKVINP